MYWSALSIELLRLECLYLGEARNKVYIISWKITPQTLVVGKIIAHKRRKKAAKNLVAFWMKKWVKLQRIPKIQRCWKARKSQKNGNLFQWKIMRGIFLWTILTRISIQGCLWSRLPIKSIFQRKILFLLGVEEKSFFLLWTKQARIIFVPIIYEKRDRKDVDKFWIYERRIQGNGQNLKEDKETEKRTKKLFWKKLLCFKIKGNSKEEKTNFNEIKFIEKNKKYYMIVQQYIMSLNSLVNKNIN